MQTVRNNITVTNFGISQMSKTPLICQDKVSTNVQSIMDKSHSMQGSRMMHFGATRTDNERIGKSVQTNSRLDIDPIQQPEHRNFTLRPRSKQSEVGPQFKFRYKLQQERLMDQLNQTFGTNYAQKNVKSGPDARKNRNDKRLNDYLHSGEYQDLPNVYAEDFEDEIDYDHAKQRKSKVNQANYVIEPRRLLNNFH